MRRLSLLTLLTAFCFVGLSGGISSQAAQIQRDATAMVLQDAEVQRVEQLFSHQPTYSRPAPRLWSSRLEVRWNARWEDAPRYAV
jgi:hypothetical protein